MLLQLLQFTDVELKIMEEFCVIKKSIFQVSGSTLSAFLFKQLFRVVISAKISLFNSETTLNFVIKTKLVF